MSRDLKITPAEVYAVGDDLVGPYVLGKDWAVFCFNRAVTTFGSALVAEMEGIKSNSKNADQAEREVQTARTAVFDKWLKIDKAPDAAKSTAKFADPAKR